jgi:hypothetical protein
MSIYFKHDGFATEEDGIAHGFFGSVGGVSKGLYASLNCGLATEDHPANIRANRVLAMEALGVETSDLHNVYQIHSNKCVHVEPGNNGKKPSEADALVTDQAGHTLSILTADCTPVLFRGKKEDGSHVIGAAHAGWKGALSGVLENTVKNMHNLGAKKESIYAVIGPTIGPESYEVGSEFKANFVNTNEDFYTYFKTLKSQIFFDLPSFCADRLRSAGVENVLMKNLDTYFHEDEFFSYRRSTHRRDKDYGRQISLISIS